MVGQSVFILILGAAFSESTANLISTGSRIPGSASGGTLRKPLANNPNPSISEIAKKGPTWTRPNLISASELERRWMQDRGRQLPNVIISKPKQSSKLPSKISTLLSPATAAAAAATPAESWIISTSGKRQDPPPNFVFPPVGYYYGSDSQSPPKKSITTGTDEGECVSLVKWATPWLQGHATSEWRGGDQVVGNKNIKTGTPIATFAGPNGAYNNPDLEGKVRGRQHAVLYVNEEDYYSNPQKFGQADVVKRGKPNDGSFLLLEQWAGKDGDGKARIKRVFPGRSRTVGNDANNYRLIELNID